MRGVKVFAGRSHPHLSDAICQRLGMSTGVCDLGNFANGETSVQINTSIRGEDVFIVQSGSRHINDSVMELLIMIAACKGGSAKSITAVMPYFPYARSSKKKSHRGPITAKMIANLLAVAGVQHIITLDLHASQMQGFFHFGVDNLRCEALLARWIKEHIAEWKNTVIVSKNVGGSKRVTSLADTLRVNFALCSTDRKRVQQYMNMLDSVVFFDAIEPNSVHSARVVPKQEDKVEVTVDNDLLLHNGLEHSTPLGESETRTGRQRNVRIDSNASISTQTDDNSSGTSESLSRVTTIISARRPSEYEAEDNFDEKAKDVVVARIVGGHLIDDDYPSPALSGMSASMHGIHRSRNSDDSIDEPAMDHMMSSFVSTASSFSPGHALGGTFDAASSSEDEEDNIKNPDLEHTITLVGKVRDKIAIIHDDIMDRSGSWIAAAETCAKRGGAKKVYCIGIHALLGEHSLEEMEACDSIDHIVVTNTFPISAERMRVCKKLIVIDMSNLLAEAIRRNHHGGTEHILSILDCANCSQNLSQPCTIMTKSGPQSRVRSPSFRPCRRCRSNSEHGKPPPWITELMIRQLV